MVLMLTDVDSIMMIRDIVMFVNLKIINYMVFLLMELLKLILVQYVPMVPKV